MSMSSADFHASGMTTFSSLGGQRKIGVFRALHLGDLLCAVPALRALRAAAPRAHITLIGLPWAAGFVRRFGRYLDAHAIFPGFPGFPEHPADVGRIPAFISAMQRERFDVVLQMHGSGVLSNPLTMTFGAAHNAGFYLEGNYCPDLYHFMRWDERQHEILRNLQLMEMLGAPAQGEDLEFPLCEQDYRSLFKSSDALPAPDSYVCIHPGARLPSCRWQAERFAEVADRLREGGWKTVLTGSAQEMELARAVERAMRSTPLNLCGKTDLGAFAALVAQARLVVCNDTGISHIAAATRTPSVVVSCGADPQRWAPLNGRRHQVVGAGHLTVEAVLAAAERVLEGNPLSFAAPRPRFPAREMRQGA